MNENKQSRRPPVIAAVACIALMVVSGASSDDDSPVSSGQVTDNSKVHESIDFSQGKAEVVICVLDESGRPFQNCTTLENILALIPPERVKVRDCPDTIVAWLDQAECIELAVHPGVDSIVRNLRVYPLLYDAVEIVRAVDAWAMEVGMLNLTAQGQTIAIVDSGIDWSHPDLANKNIVGATLDCTVSSDCPPDPDDVDWSGHGTMVSGCAAAEGTINGIGRGADIIALKVFPDGVPETKFYIMKRAVRWAIEHADEYGITVISMSIGSSELFTEPCDWLNGPITSAINDAVEAGIVVVIASGNGASDTGISAPACIQNAIAVAATNKDDTLAPYSNYNGLVKIFAPGSAITSTWPGGEYFEGYGTSLAAPIAAGAIAIVRQFLDSIGQSMTPSEIEQLLFATGDPIVDLPIENWSRINVENAVLALKDQFISPDLDGDGIVGPGDLAILLGTWGPSQDCPPVVPADLDLDCDVDGGDLAILLGAWG